MALDAGPQSGKKVIEAKGIAKSFGDRTILRPFDLRIQRGDRIAFVGPNGAGKSTLTRALAARFGLQLAPESIGDDNPWLEPYYARGTDSMREHALRLQLHFLATRFESMRRIRGSGGSWVLDRTWYEDAEVFARGLYEEHLMSAAEWELKRRNVRYLMTAYRNSLQDISLLSRDSHPQRRRLVRVLRHLQRRGGGVGTGG